MIKRATTIAEQLTLLADRGVVITDRDKAQEILLDVGYYRMGFYLFPFERTYPNLGKKRKHRYVQGASFEHAVALYYFDADLRNVLMKYLNRIEISFRTYLTYVVSNKYRHSPTWFVDANVVSADYVKGFDSEVYTAKFRRTPVIRRHHQKYINDKYAPAWKTLEYMTLGGTLALYEHLKDIEVKRIISGHFGIRDVRVFENYMNVIRIARNTCAHGGVLFDLSLPQSIANGPSLSFRGSEKHNLKGVMTVIGFVLRQISENRWVEMNDRISVILKKTCLNFPILAAILERNSGLSVGDY